MKKIIIACFAIISGWSTVFGYCVKSETIAVDTVPLVTADISALDTSALMLWDRGNELIVRDTLGSPIELYRLTPQNTVQFMDAEGEKVLSVFIEDPLKVVYRSEDEAVQMFFEHIVEAYHPKIKELNARIKELEFELSKYK